MYIITLFLFLIIYYYCARVQNNKERERKNNNIFSDSQIDDECVIIIRTYIYICTFVKCFTNKIIKPILFYKWYRVTDIHGYIVSYSLYTIKTSSHTHTQRIITVHGPPQQDSCRHSSDINVLQVNYFFTSTYIEE